MKLFLVLGLTICLFSVFAEGKKKSSRRSKVVNVDFDDELLIKGKLLGPSIFTLHQKKNLNYGKLIKPKENFLPELRETLREIN